MADQVDPLPLAAPLGLDDEELLLVALLLVSHSHLQFIHVRGQQLGLRLKVLLFLVDFADLVQTLGQKVFPGQQLHSREVVYLLLILQLAQFLRKELGIEPNDVIVVELLILHFFNRFVAI